MTPRAILFTVLSLLGAVFIVCWFVLEQRRGGDGGDAGGAERAGGGRRRTLLQIGIGALTNFFDTLGIGSFASTTSLYKLGRQVTDENIPGTLNVGHTLPTFAQAFIFIAVVEVEMNTLVAMIAAAVAGAFLGAGVVASWPRRRIQIGMGLLLFVAAAIIALRQLALVPGGGTAIGIGGAHLAVGMAGNFVLGALMTLGIGLYAPCMILVSLLGMNVQTAFPIMMGSCAFLMPVAGFRFIRSGRYDLRAAVGLAVGGVPAALVAGLIVKSLPLQVMQWLVVGVVVYTAAIMLRSAAQTRAASPQLGVAAPVQKVDHQSRQ